MKLAWVKDQLSQTRERGAGARCAAMHGESSGGSAPAPGIWRQVYRQFGVHPSKASDKRTVDAFRTKVLRELKLKKIKLAWPGLNYATAPGVLILHPSTPVIAPVDQRQLAS